jgi:putative Holliday junction resolvase
MWEASFCATDTSCKQPILKIDAEGYLCRHSFMARILGIDYGTKRTGLAVTDPLKIIVSPLASVSTPEVPDFLKNYMMSEPVEALVCGLPGSENTETLQSLKAFIAELKVHFPLLPIHFQDEHRTSREASALIFKSGVKKMKRRDKGLIDRVSAVLILQEYLGHLNDVHTL